MTSERNPRHLAQRLPARPGEIEAEHSSGGDGTKDGHAEIIRRDPVLWNAWRRNNPEIIPDLTGLALGWCERRMGTRDGGPLDLKFARLQEVDLCFADLEGADLEAADLARADLQHACLVEAKLNAADLIDARLDHADLAGARAKKADLAGCVLRFARLRRADLRGADLSGADLLHAQCRDADFSGANLTNARLDHADLAGAKLADADLSGTSLHHARNLTAAQLEEAKGNDLTSLPPELEGFVSWSAPKKNTLKSMQATQPVEARRVAPAGNNRIKLAALVSGAALLALLVAGVGIRQLDGAPPLSMAIFSGAPDQAPREVARPVRPDAHAAFLPPGDMARSGAAEGLAPSKAHELAPTREALEATGAVDATPKQATAAIEFASTPAAAEAKSGVDATPTEAMTAVELASTPTAVEAKSGAAAVPMAATAALDAAAEITPAAIVAASPDDEVHATAPAARRLAEASDAAVPAVPPKDIDMPGAETMSALSAKVSALDLRLAADHYLDLPARDAVMIRIASRVDALRPIVPKRATHAIEVAALPGETAPDATPVEAPVETGPPEPLLLTISLLEQKLNVYRGLELVETTKVSSGARGYETRTGVFSILEKKRYHHSNLYSNAPMPWMQRLTRSGTALHAGVVPNYPASHGCIRLPFSFAPKLFKITEVGANVVVAGHMPEPSVVEHPNLFHPVAAQADATASDDDAPRPLRMLVTRRTERDKLISVQERLAELGYLAPQTFTGKRGGATNTAIKEFQKANGLPATGEVTDDLVKSVHEAAGKPAPPAGHLFVRRGYKRLFDVPVAVSNPAAPLGTYAFTALHFAPGDAKAPWVGVTVEGGDARAALDRIEIPDEARERISGLLTPGATFIIAETSQHSAILPQGDDFIISATEVPSSGPQLAAASHSPTNLKRAKPRSRVWMKPRRTVRHYYYPQQRVRRGFFFRW
jgi:uncharacterized protein YjbI with pentapeptide repeats/lipoprotein-anchoring transpeptidase ErfK/SrfK/peptidoglycan hydrolase-like protein with peptidoglycan-binding domain